VSQRSVRPGLAGPPREPVSTPLAVVTLAAGRDTRCAWENEAGGLTFEVGDGPDRVFIKWAPRGSDVDLGAEAARLAWAAPFSPVPVVIQQGSDAQGSWLVTRALPGRSAVDLRWVADPGPAVQAIGIGLRALHDALPVESCPYSWSAADRLGAVQRRAATGLVNAGQWHEENRGMTVGEALERLAAPPAVDRAVVCHGDACTPNTLLTDDGRWSGHVDFGALGVGDRWADLAIATWSTVWNYGPGWEDPLLAAYGVAPDPGRTRYYRLLWDLG
jgi:aminoglycoside phosphotransferase